MEKTGRARLREYCDRHGYKQYELAEMLEITDAYLSQIFSGARRPSLPIAVKIQDITGIPAASWMLTERDKSKKKPAASRDTDEICSGKVENGHS